MATITTTGTGDYASTTPNAPWPSGTIPDYTTDTVVVASGNTLTISDTRNVPAISIGTTLAGQVGKLILDGGGAAITITAYGNITLNTATNQYSELNINAGATLNIQGNIITIPTSATASFGTWKMTGTAGNLAKIVGSSGSYFTSAAARLGVDWDYFEISGVVNTGASTGNSLTGWNTGAYFKLNHGYIHDCGAFNLYNRSLDGQLTVDNTDVRNITSKNLSLAGAGFILQRETTASPQGATRIKGCTFKNAAIVGVTGMNVSALVPVIEDLIVYDTILYSYNSVVTRACYYTPDTPTFATNGIIVAGNSGGINNSLVLADNYNTHTFQVGSNLTTFPKTFDFSYNIIEGSGAPDNQMFSDNRADIVWSVHHNIMIGPGNFMEWHDSHQTNRFNFYNNTFDNLQQNSTNYGFVFHHETTTADLGRASFKNNLIIDNATDGNVNEAISHKWSSYTYWTIDYSNYNAHISDRGALYSDYGDATYITNLSSVTPLDVGVNDISVAGNYNTNVVRNYVIKVIAGGATSPNTYQWSNDGGTNWSATANMTTSYVTLENQIQVKWAAITGHTVDGTWSFDTIVHNKGAGDFASNDIAAGTIPLTGLFVNHSLFTGDYNSVGSKLLLVKELLKLNGRDFDGNSAEYNSTYSVSNVLSFIRDSRTPTNLTLATAGEAGTYIGAVEPAAPADDYHPAAFLMGY